jgi:hypothetical protein
MRLTACLFMVVIVAFAKHQPVSDLNGIWVSGLANCDPDTSTSCNRVILNVTRDGNRLKVIEVASGEVGTSVAERQYVFKRPLRHVGQGVGTAKAAGRRIVLRSSEQLERWSISADGSELIVNRSIGIDPKGPQRVLFFRRSERTAESSVRLPNGGSELRWHQDRASWTIVWNSTNGM